MGGADEAHEIGNIERLTLTSKECFSYVLRTGERRVGPVTFPLTPALSLGEREKLGHTFRLSIADELNPALDRARNNYVVILAFFSTA